MSEYYCDIDFSKEGRQRGYFHVPCPRNTSAWGTIPVTIGFYKRGEGPKVLLTAGAHGDEFEGPVALRKLMNRLEKVDFCGEVTIVPVMNVPAMQVGLRLSPLDGRDLNRSFTKGLEGVTGLITAFVMDHLIPRADIVLDFHSGGNSLDFLPAIIMHELPDKKLQEKTWQALKAFNAPYGIILDEIDDTGMLDSYVEGLGKMFLTTELRGGGGLSPHGVRVAENGLIRLLHHLGILSDISSFSDVLTDFDSQYFHVPDGNSFVRAFSHGVFEAFVSLGDEVGIGQVVGQIHNIESADSDVVELRSSRDGVVLANRPRALCGPGDCLLMIAQRSDEN